MIIPAAVAGVGSLESPVLFIAKKQKKHSNIPIDHDKL